MPAQNEEQLKYAVSRYVNIVDELYRNGNVESSYYGPIIDLFTAFGCRGEDFSGERSGAKGENIDIKLWRAGDNLGEAHPFSAVEVKKVNGKYDRDRAQILTEAQKYGIVILTDNRTWEFYRAGDSEMYNGFLLMKDDGKGGLALDESKTELFIQSIKDFILAEPVNVKSSNKLAFYMAQHAKTIRVTVGGILQTDSTKRMYDDLNALYTRLKQELLPELNVGEFADMYAQTIVYGLFIARYNDKASAKFTRGEAIANLAKESHLLKQFFQHIANSGALHPTLNDAIEKLCKLYSITNLAELLDKSETKDTIIHFYEEFLSFYDAKQRMDRGVFYTPVPIVRHIVKAVDKMLIDEFGIINGLSNNDTIDTTVKSEPYTVKKKNGKVETKTDKVISVSKVAILDPACGTGTFGAEVIRFIKEKYFSGAKSAFYNEWINNPNGLLSRLVGFEIMMTSYVVAHLKIRRTIAETIGQQPDEIVSGKIYLTNTLDKPETDIEPNKQISFFDFSGAITDEAQNASKWKARRPIKVIMGNPPYLSASKTQFDISAYKFEPDGVTKLNEKNPKWINDDYVKFIRFAEQHIEKDGNGILAYVSNNGYLDNPTFRGMRASLLRTFDKIYILNLHGNSNKQETSPDGSKDGNVFDIKVGVAIIIAVKSSASKNWAKVYYSEVYGLREHKFAELERGDFKFEEIAIDKKTALFMPQRNEGAQKEYEGGVSLAELFNVYSSGMVLGRDAVCVQNTKAEIESVVKDFRTKAVGDLRLKYRLPEDTRDWSVAGAKADTESVDGSFRQVAYRPFDIRWTYYTGRSKGFHCMPRGDVMRNFVSAGHKNVGIIFARGDTTQWPFSMVFVTDTVVEARITVAQTAGICSVAPLYVAPSELVKTWEPNISKKYFELLTHNLKTPPSPAEVFDYCYGVLYDIGYRGKYNEFLKRDYPRVPIIRDEKTFALYRDAGEKLRKLHLMQTGASCALEFSPAKPANLRIESVKYTGGKLRFNKETEIVGIPQDAWDYYVGGYRVLDKWFKSHSGETLDLEKFSHIEKVVGVLLETVKIQASLQKALNA